MKYDRGIGRYNILWNSCFEAGVKKICPNTAQTNLGKCGRTNSGQPSSFFLQIATICLDRREKFAAIFSFCTWQPVKSQPPQ